MRDIEMVQTPHGKVINAESMVDLGNIQNDRGKFVFDNNYSVDVLAIIDREMAANGFEWLYSGVNKSEKSIRGIFFHNVTGYVFRAELSPKDKFWIDSWADERVYYSGPGEFSGKESGRGVSGSVKELTEHDITSAIRAVVRDAIACYGVSNGNSPKPVATPVKEKVDKPKTGLSSADHVEAILDIVNDDYGWLKQTIWNDNKDDEVYQRLPDQMSITSGGFVSSCVSTGQKKYPSEEDFWSKVEKFKYSPKLGKIKKSHWRRDSRKKIGGSIERKFDMSFYNISATTIERNGIITSIKFFESSRYKSGFLTKERLIKEVAFPDKDTVNA